jgi:UDP-N-acetylmuramoyl-tripeptide--D-alanyl-D-alanine ligase
MATPIPKNDAPFTVWDLAAATRGDLTRLPDERASVQGLVTDSRTVIAGNAFVAVRGERFDGHDFLGFAIERGATAVVVEKGRGVPEGNVAVIEVNDVLTAFGLLARAHLQRWRRTHAGQASVVAVTGSAGKTTTKELLLAILSAVGPTHGTTGNLNNRVGVPAVALGVTSERYAVFELGMNVPGEIAALASIVEPDVSILLNVGVAHAEAFGGSRAGIAREKGAIFEALGEAGVAIVNVDDDAARAELFRTRARHVGFGTSSGADVRLVRREAASMRGSVVTIDRRGETFDISLPALGDAVAMDLLAAIAASDALVGHPIPLPVIAQAVQAWHPPGGRSVTIELLGDILVIDDSYNANPASMRAAFATLEEARRSGRSRAIAVLGEMRELGSISTREHEELGAELVRHGVDLVIGCGGAIDATLRRAAAGHLPVKCAGNADEAGAMVATEARPGDVILFKGSRGAAVERALAALVARYPRLPAASTGSP